MENKCVVKMILELPECQSIFYSINETTLDLVFDFHSHHVVIHPIGAYWNILLSNN